MENNLPPIIGIISKENLAKIIAVSMTGANRNPPILRGKGARRDLLDQHRTDFARWLADALMSGGAVMVQIDSGPTPRSNGFMEDMPRRVTPGGDDR